MAKKVKCRAKLEAEYRAMYAALQRIAAFSINDVPPEKCKGDNLYPYAFGCVRSEAEFALRVVDEDFC